MITVFIDGLCEPVNPGGVACWGFTIYRDSGKELDGKGVIGEGPGMSNNLAEYTALCKALKELLNHSWENEEVIVKSDSRLLVNQMAGWWQVHGGLYSPAYLEAFKLTKRFQSIKYVWIPREQNEEADALSRRAYEEYRRTKGLQPKYGKAAGLQSKKETCMTCIWVRFSGPHIGCYRNYAYHGWLPKHFATNSKCPDYQKKEAS